MDILFLSNQYFYLYVFILLVHSEPVKPRPTTSAVLARRLVSGALGLRVQASKEQRDQERTILKEAKGDGIY